MKAMTLIPKEIKKTYQIEKYENAITIDHPAYINIDIDDKFEIKNGRATVDIINSKCHVSLWKKTFLMHITIYK